jgi:alpha/beta superfamily hydrolase
MTEPISFTNSQGLSLHGTLVTPNRPVREIIIMSHGFMADKEQGGMFTEAAEGFRKSGFSSFRFDFSGSGQSESTSLSVSKHVDDLTCALELMLTRGFNAVGLLGYSLGALYSILSYRYAVKTMVLWAPVTASKVPTKLKEESVQKELNDKGYTTFTNKQGKNFVIEKAYLTERLAINQKKILSPLTCPVMIIHGCDDKTVPVEHSYEAEQILSTESRLWVIEEADHSFQQQRDILLNLSEQWFEKHLK